MLSGPTTDKELSSAESMMDYSISRRYSAISKHSLVMGTPKAIREWLMCSQPVSLVRGGVQSENMPVKMTSETDGPKQGESLSLFDLDLFNLKTPLTSSLRASSFESSKTLPHSVMWDAHHVYQDYTLERTLKESVRGLKPNCPTPLMTDYKGGTTSLRNGKPRLDQFRDFVKIKYGWTYPIPEHSEQIIGIPIGWTELKPLETCKFQQWLSLHGRCSE